jgi:phosphoglycerol transferase MdoB-like AlkP superfamily enzyme
MLPVPRLIRWILVLAALSLGVLSGLRVAVWIAFNDSNLTLAEALTAFWLGVRFDARVVAGVLLPLLLLGSIRGLHALDNPRGRRLWTALLSAAAAAVLVLYVFDFLHLRYLGQRLNASALSFLEDAAISALMVWQTYPVVKIAIALAAAIAAAFGSLRITHRRSVRSPETPLPRWRAAWWLAATFACLLAIFGRVGQYPLRWSDAFVLRNDFAANLALNPVQSFLSSLDFRGSGYDLALVRQAYPLMSDYLGVTDPDAEKLNFVRHVPARADAPARRPNVVLVICESFSAYKSSMWGNRLDTTPYFAELCRDGLFFDKCFTPLSGTARGIWATITGLPDVEPVKTASRNPGMVDQHTIINDFVGYRKLYFLGGSTSWANIRGLLTNNIHGLELYEEDYFKSPRVDVWGISDKNLLLEAEQVLARQQEPFFAIIQTAGNHRPYTIPEEDLDEFTRLELTPAEVAQHGFSSLEELNAFRYTDFTFRAFMTAARKSAYFDNTVFVFIGDHGVAGNAGTLFPPAWTEQALTTYHVPLLYYAPKLIAPRRISSPSSMLDTLPTLAGLAGIPYRNSGLGRDLLERERRDGGRGNAAFILDQNNKTVGAIRGPHFSYLHWESKRSNLVWADFSPAPSEPDPAAGAIAADSIRFAEAFHETARYLLLNNRKPRESPEAR